MRWASADTLEVEITLRGNETALSTVDVPNAGRVTLAPVTLPYSPEFKPVSSEEGQVALARLAQATGGKERIELSGVWKNLQRQPRLIGLTPWLLMLAILMLLIEVFERYTGLITGRMLPALKREREPISKPKAVELKRPRTDTVTKANEPVSQPTDDERQVEDKVEPAEPAAILDALRKARQQAKERTKR